MKVGRKIKKPEKLNLVPILDSVFIFIFFLLMSAQFVDVYEIGSALPMVKEAPEQTKSDKDPLNLTLEIDKEKGIVVKTGMRNPRSRSFASTQHAEMKTYLRELKTANPDEYTTDPKLPFQSLIAVIDATQEPKDSKQKLFEQIVFDNSGVE
jgi:biopolymer transport protein ExbD